MIWRIFTRDVFRLLKNPVAVVITLGVALIPSLYAWCNIVANWDPYANTGNIKVAVANEDQGANNELIGRLNAGQNVVSALKNNHELGWQFVDEDTAKRAGHSQGFQQQADRHGNLDRVGYQRGRRRHQRDTWSTHRLLRQRKAQCYRP